MHTRPSTVYGIERMYGDFAAYCFDQCVVAWGTAFENDVASAVSNAKNQASAAAAPGRVLRAWVPQGAASYADPARR